jgi:hypothetical protein
MPLFAIEVDLSILLGNEDTPYLRDDHDQGTLSRKGNLMMHYND